MNINHKNVEEALHTVHLVNKLNTVGIINKVDKVDVVSKINHLHTFFYFSYSQSITTGQRFIGRGCLWVSSGRNNLVDLVFLLT